MCKSSKPGMPGLVRLVCEEVIESSPDAGGDAIVSCCCCGARRRDATVQEVALMNAKNGESIVGWRLPTS